MTRQQIERTDRDEKKPPGQASEDIAEFSKCKADECGWVLLRNKLKLLARLRHRQEMKFESYVLCRRVVNITNNYLLRSNYARFMYT